MGKAKMRKIQRKFMIQLIIAKMSSLKEEIKPISLVAYCGKLKMAFHQPPDCTFSEIYYKVCNQAGDNGGIEKNPAPIYLLQNQQIYIYIKNKNSPPPQFFLGKIHRPTVLFGVA